MKAVSGAVDSPLGVCPGLGGVAALLFDILPGQWSSPCPKSPQSILEGIASTFDPVSLGRQSYYVSVVKGKGSSDLYMNLEQRNVEIYTQNCTCLADAHKCSNSRFTTLKICKMLDR